MTISESQRKAARIAGLAQLFSFVSVVSVYFGIFVRLIVPGDPAQTARNILAHIFELALSFWLLFKGLRPSGVAESDKASA